MERNTRQNIRRKKQHNVLRALLVLLMATALVYYGHALYAAVLVLAYYLFREAYLSDHIFYSVTEDYCHHLAPHWRQPVRDTAHIDGTIPGSAPEKIDTLLLATKIRSTALGHLLDPYVQIAGEGFSYRQYFERGARGLRYINLTQQLHAKNKNATLTFTRCRAVGPGELLGFANGLQDNCLQDHGLQNKKRVMVIAPHADDAELAAFGLYSSNEAMVVTLTAGETEAEDLLVEGLATEPDPAKASQLKGQLRSEDSVAAARLGGVPPERIVSLGYFCKQLKTMQKQPEVAVASLSAGIADTRFFRQHNCRRLLSDAHGTPSWNSLVADLRELLADFRPQVIVTPHPLLDPHPDHRYGTLALREALEGLAQNEARPPVFLLYANHYHNTQQAPFGPAHSGVGLPPLHGEAGSGVAAVKVGVYCQVLDAQAQEKKAAALQLMHDLQRKVSWSKRLRPLIQQWLAARPRNPYGQDDFFRKAVRCQEVFLVTDSDGLRQLLASDGSTR